MIGCKTTWKYCELCIRNLGELKTLVQELGELKTLEELEGVEDLQEVKDLGKNLEVLM